MEQIRDINSDIALIDAILDLVEWDWGASEYATANELLTHCKEILQQESERKELKIMKRIITVYEFCSWYLEPLQQIKISSHEDETLLFKGKVKDILSASDITLYNTELKLVQQYHDLTAPDGIELFI